ncbi:MAG: DUF4097 domain-containing protein [Gammaproteobacteria bacterium]|nr:DUF4097 domain-containing protein [Gammaproteobacteria bacterium]
MRISRILSTITAVLLVIFLGASANAAGEVTKVRAIDAQSISSVTLKAGVGSVRVEPGSGAAIEARVVLRAKRSTGIFSSLPDVEKLEISATTRGDQLELDMDAKNIQEDWVLKLPTKEISALEIMCGVGEIKVTAPAKRVELDLGVGDAEIDIVTGAIKVRVGTGDLRIKTGLSNAGAVEGTTGVGSASLKGLEGTVKSNVVGSRVYGQGGGQQPIDAMVGVGDLTIELTQ